MTHSVVLRQRIVLTMIVCIAALAHLAWEHLNGGIRSHHFLGSTNYPAMHNVWGALLLPVLAWFLGGTIAKRTIAAANEDRQRSSLPRSIAIGFVLALLHGIALSVSFANGFENVTSMLFFATFVLCVLFPVYRGECVLGFIFGMTFTFGPFIPTFFAGVFGLLSASLHLALYPFALRFARKARARA